MIRANNIEKIITGNPNLNFKVLAVNNHLKVCTTNSSPQCTDSNLLMFCKSYIGYFKIGDQNFEIVPQRIILIPGNIPHKAYHNPKNFISLVAIRFTTSPDSKIFGDQPYILDLPQTSAFSSIIENMVNFTLTHDIHNSSNNQVVSNLLKSIFWNIVAVLQSTNGLSNDIKINQAIHYIEQSLYQYKYLTVDEILSHLQMSNYEFTTRFKQATGVTFRTYLFEKKMQIAKQLLLTDEYSIDRIAGILGYSDRYIFSNQFKKYFHISPAKLRDIELKSSHY